jgi:hypothetical protein
MVSRTIHFTMLVSWAGRPILAAMREQWRCQDEAARCWDGRNRRDGLQSQSGTVWRILRPRCSQATSRTGAHAAPSTERRTSRSFSWKCSNYACAPIGGFNFAFDVEQNSTITGTFVLRSRGFGLPGAFGAGPLWSPIARPYACCCDTLTIASPPTASAGSGIRSASRFFYEVFGRVV